MKLFDKVYVKSKKTMGFIVDIIENSYTVEKDGDEGPIFWNLPEEDLKQLLKAQRAFEKAYEDKKKNPDGKATTVAQYSVSAIIGNSGKNYGIGVRLDSDFITGLSEQERKEMVKLLVVEELAGSSFIAYDNGNPVEIRIAQKSDKIKTNNGQKKPVLKELYRKYIGNETKQEAVVLSNELSVCRYAG